MKQPYYTRLASWRLTITMLMAAGLTSTAFAAPTSLAYDRFVETKTVGSPLQAGTTLRIDGALVDSTTSSIANTLFFTMGSTSLSVSAGWLVAPAQNATVGVNLDLFDFNHNLVASDVFLGVNGSLATSLLNASNLIAGGRYELLFTGSAAQAGRYGLALTAGAPGPAVDTLAAANPPANRALFDTHVGEKTLGSTLANGAELIIDGKMEDDALSGIVNEVKFTSTASRLSAGIEWIIGGTTDPQRTVGVNVDIFDASNSLVASDSFQGITDGQAFSQLTASSIGPGAYTLRFTGTAALGGRYRIHLTTNEVPPGFEAIVDSPPVTNVPEPESWALLAAGLVALVGRGIRRANRTIGQSEIAASDCAAV